MRKPIIIYGAGGLGREVLSLCYATDQWEVVGFIDDQKQKGMKINGVHVLGPGTAINEIDNNVHIVFAIGDPLMKQQVVASVGHRLPMAVLKHPSAIIQDENTVSLGVGSVISAGAILTTNIAVGDHVLVNLNVTVGHDCTLGSYDAIMPGVNIGGNVTLGDAVLIGSGANILNGVVIGDRCRVGMGAVVIRDVAADLTVAGVPAKPIKS